MVNQLITSSSSSSRAEGKMTVGLQKKGRLVLQDGSVFPGEIFGASKATAGEVGEYWGNGGTGQV